MWYHLSFLSIIHEKKSVIILIVVLPSVFCLFVFSGHFKTQFLCLVFNSLIMMYLRIIFFVFILHRTSWAFRKYELTFIISFERFQAIVCSNIFSTLFSLPRLLLRLHLYMFLTFGTVWLVSDTLIDFVLFFNLWLLVWTIISTYIPVHGYFLLLFPDRCLSY